MRERRPWKAEDDFWDVEGSSDMGERVSESWEAEIEVSMGSSDSPPPPTCGSLSLDNIDWWMNKMLHLSFHDTQTDIHGDSQQQQMGRTPHEEWQHGFHPYHHQQEELLPRVDLIESVGEDLPVAATAANDDASSEYKWVERHDNAWWGESWYKLVQITYMYLLTSSTESSLLPFEFELILRSEYRLEQHKQTDRHTQHTNR